MFLIKSENWFLPCDNNEFDQQCNKFQKNSILPMGVNGLFRGSGIVFFSFIGFDSVSSLAEECKNPKKDIVYGILGTLIIAIILYICVSIVLTGMIPFTAIDTNAPLSQAFMLLGYVLCNLFIFLFFLFFYFFIFSFFLESI